MNIFCHIKSVIKRLMNKNFNLRSHIKYANIKLFKKNIKLSDEVIFDKRSNIRVVSGKAYIGEYLRIKEGSEISVISGELHIGNGVFVNRNCIITCRKSIIIGDEVTFGPNVTIWDHDHKFDKNQVYGTEYKTGEIIIGKGCWIGAGAIILRNTRVGEGSVIGAGTVVKGDIPPHSLVTMGRDLIIRPIRDK